MQTINAAEILHLSIPERIQLVEDIWDSIAANQEVVEITTMQKDELDLRLADYEKAPRQGDQWQAVRTRLWQLL